MGREIQSFIKYASHALELHISIAEKERSEKNAVKVAVKALDARDPYTKNHSVEVAEISKLIAEELTENFLKENEVLNKAAFIERLYLAALLHDIGKIGISEAILLKKDRLDIKEKLEMDTHPFMGAEIIKDTIGFGDIREIIMHHHESFDGERGYPYALKGAEIPAGSRIIAVADSYHAMTSNRPYRSALNYQMAYDEIRILSNGFKINDEVIEQQYDPKVFEAFHRAIIKDKQNGRSRFNEINVKQKVFDDENFLLIKEYFKEQVKDIIDRNRGSKELSCISIIRLNRYKDKTHLVKTLYAIKRKMIPKGALFSNWKDNKYIIYFPNARIKDVNILCSEIRDKLYREENIIVNIGIVEVTPEHKDCKDILNRCFKAIRKANGLNKEKGSIVMFNDIHC